MISISPVIKVYTWSSWGDLKLQQARAPSQRGSWPIPSCAAVTCLTQGFGFCWKTLPWKPNTGKDLLLVTVELILPYELILSLIIFYTYTIQPLTSPVHWLLLLKTRVHKWMPQEAEEVQIFTLGVYLHSDRKDAFVLQQAGKNTLWSSHPEFFQEQSCSSGKDYWKLSFQIFAIFLLHQILWW